MAALELDDYLRHGNIKNSVNFPNVDMPMSAAVRVCVLHANVPAVLSQLTSVLSAEGINIENLTNKSKGNNAYTMLDISAAPAETAIEKLAAVSGVYRVRVIH
jgi:D-3-phosphoglycerate dehydrogenase